MYINIYRPILATLCFLLIPISIQAKFITAQQHESYQFMADVAETQILDHPTQSVRLFSYTGGDPALNGLLLNIAVWNDRQHRWNVYALKNVSSYKVLPSAQPGYYKLELKTEDLNADGDVITNTSLLYINLDQAHLPQKKIEVKEVAVKSAN